MTKLDPEDPRDIPAVGSLLSLQASETASTIPEVASLTNSQNYSLRPEARAYCRACDKQTPHDERREDDAARAIVAARAPDAIMEPGSGNRVAEIDREFERLVAKRPKPGTTAADLRRRKASALHRPATAACLFGDCAHCTPSRDDRRRHMSP